ncbi:MAG: alpha-galactosidase, partial [Bacteroidia bacterium]|nr:alpha-galactosidase [Bacteroidia bacterium]
LASYGNVRVIGLGIDEDDITADRWTSAYSTVLGLFSKGEYNALLGLKKYQSRIRKVIPDRDEMIMMNTWGDRGVGKRINETYIIKELELCQRLGVTHFQIDDGWQTGKSPATTQNGSFDNIWANPDYWKPDPNNFPNGLKYVVEKGEELGVEVCIWFNPSYTDNYIDWKRDAEALIYLNRQYGIRTFKIDGLRIHNKISEERVDSMLSAVAKSLNYDVVFNLDVTADKRFGFYYKNRFGNIFLENRYTDFGSYYPYWTLRNLWSLSKYVPTRNLQIEFLNKWRNRDKYNDVFAPEHYDFEYLFAISMMAQPLAWMEAQNLPEEAFDLHSVIRRYRGIQADLHKGYILPIGDKPSGRSWTGFQSIQENHGYFLIFREKNAHDSKPLNTWLKPGTKIRLELILGKGESFNTQVDENNQIIFTLGAENSYSLYKYVII